MVSNQVQRLVNELIKTQLPAMIAEYNAAHGTDYRPGQPLPRDVIEAMADAELKRIKEAAK